MNKIISIAGSDSISGAGIQMDIRIGMKLNTYVATAISAITIQDSSKIHYFKNVDPKVFADQIKVIMGDFVDAKFIKVGMVSSMKNMQTICQETTIDKSLIVDPIISSTSKHEIISATNLVHLKTILLPRAFLLTPNINEAQIISGHKIKNTQDVKIAATIIRKMGVKNILIKGAHLNSKNISHFLLKENGESKIFKNKRLPLKKEVRGTGCAISTAITCFLAMGHSLEMAIRKSNIFVYYKIKNNLQDIGKGNSLIL